MAEYIEREAALSGIMADGCKASNIEVLMNVPAADVVEVRHGEWVHSDKAAHWFGKDKCSECYYRTYDGLDLSHFNYCPNCGAKMDGGNTNAGR